MQVSDEKYGYKGTLDAFIKIYKEQTGFQKRLPLTATEGAALGIVQKAQNKITSIVDSALSKFYSVRNLYKGIFWYSLHYTAFVALEFAFFDSSLMYFEKLHEEWLKEKRRKQ